LKQIKYAGGGRPLPQPPPPSIALVGSILLAQEQPHYHPRSYLLSTVSYKATVPFAQGSVFRAQERLHYHPQPFLLPTVSYAAAPPPTTFFGDLNARFSSIDTTGGIALSHSSMTVPAFVHVSAMNIGGTGQVLNVDGSTNGTATLRPYERLEFKWDFGDPGGTEIFTDPRVRANGATVNANTDQYGPEAVYCYRTSGTKTITLSIRGLAVGGGYITAQVQANFQANTFSGTDYYYDNRSPNGGIGTQGSPYNAFGQGPISANGSVNGNNIRLNFAYGSVFSNPVGLQNVQNCTLLRVQPWTNNAFPSSAKPIIESTVTGVALSSSNNVAYSDHVYSSIVFRQAASVQNYNGTLTFVAPKGNKNCTTVRGTISNGSGGAGNNLNSSHIYGNSNAAVTSPNTGTVFSVNGTVAPGTTIASGSSGTFVVSGAAQNTAVDDMMIIPVASCAAFTGTIASNVLTISPPPGYSSLTGCGTPATGQLILASTTSVGSYRTIGTNIDATHWNVSAGADSVTPQLMVCGAGGQAVTDLYVDNCDVISLSTQANGIAVTGVGNNGPGSSFTADVSGNVMTASGTITNPIIPGQVVTGTGFKSNTFIVNQLTGSAGGAGTYTLSSSQGTLTSVAATTVSGVRVSVASTSIFIVGSVYMFGGVNITGGSVQINGPQEITAIGSGYVDLIKAAAGLGTYAGGGTTWTGGGGGTSFAITGNGIFDPKSFYQRTCMWGGSSITLTGNAAAGCSYGAAQWTSYVGVTVQFFGAGQTTDHQINPEVCCNNILCRWVYTNSGPGNNSGGNFAFEPRAFAGFTGTIVGDPGGSHMCVSSNFFSYTQNGAAGGCQNNTKPSYGIGWFDGVVIEANDFGWITNSAILLTGTKNVTIRDNNAWQVGALFFTGGVGSALDGLGADLYSCVYRNNVYRPSAANQGLYGSGSNNSTGIIDLHDGTSYTTQQEFTDNVIWDDRIAGNVEVVNLSFSDFAGDSCIIDRNNYYVPSSLTYMRDTPAGGGFTAKTLAQWRAVVAPPLSFDANATTSNPGWPNAPIGIFK
jgi:hypothetical protein